MRKKDKQKALEFVKTLYLAHEEINKAMDRNNPELAFTLLAQCQQGAGALENMIENLDGRESSALPSIRSYKSKLHGIGQEQMETLSFEKTYKMLISYLQEVEGDIKNFIPGRIEIVFLPYKASMWDSLESVWKAADEDENTDAYVIPIPYYEKNPDGSFREEHYEGEMYPDYVPVTHFHEYDFINRHPDIIFIHNPYDEFNLITSVHPFFYSKKLNQYTDQLVYIPYFLLKEPDVDDWRSYDNIKGFCITSGVLNADKVIVQSENMRQIYVNMLSEFMKGDKWGRSYWEKKILGLGSPKADRVRNVRRDGLEIPEDWLKIIRKSNGSRKKIVLYNISINNLLQFSEQLLEKIRNVLNVFKEREDEVALLWRPHPLIKAAIESMRPQLGYEYQTLVDQYRTDNWGIYDDTPDLDRAIVISDAYYGDESSVVQLCGEVSVPVMVQDVERTVNVDRRFVTPSALAAVGNKVYFSDQFTDGLYYFDSDTFETAYIGRLYSNSLDKRCLYHTIIKNKNKLYFIPFNSDSINIYDIQKNDIEHISLPGEWRDKAGKFYCGLVLGGKIVLFGYSMVNIWIYDLKTGGYKSLSKCAEKIEAGLCGNSRQGLFIHAAVIVKEDIYAVSLFGDFVVQINTINYKYKLIKLNSGNMGYSGISSEGGVLWLIPYSGSNFVKYNINTGDCTVLTENYASCDWSYVGAVAGNDFLFAMPCYADGPVQIDLKNSKVTIINEIKLALGNAKRENACIPPVLSDSRLVTCMPYRDEVMVFDVRSKKVRVEKLRTDERLHITENMDLFYESPLFCLEDYLVYVNQTKNGTGEAGRIGERIYQEAANGCEAVYQ